MPPEGNHPSPGLASSGPDSRKKADRESVPPPSREDTGALRLDVRPDGVAVLTYDVHGEAVNTLQASFAQELADTLDRVAREPTIKAVVLASGKPDSWVVGANIDMLRGCRTAADGEALSRGGQDAMKRIASSKKPFVAAVHGAALGGGLELALACHARVATDDRKTVLGLPEVQLGLIPGANGLLRLAAIVGLRVALDYGLTGKNMRAAKARGLGVVDEVVPLQLLLEVAAKRARGLADAHRSPPFPGAGLLARLRKLNPKGVTDVALEDNPVGRRILFRKARETTYRKTKGHYPAANAILDVLETYGSRGFDAAADIEARAFGELVVSETAKQLIGVFFATQELKKDNGVADPRVKPRAIEKIGILGAGLMGGGIATVTANAGLPVRLKDRDDASVGRGLAYVGRWLDDRVRRRASTRIEKAAVQARVTGGITFDGFTRCDVVIEAVFEDLAVKQQVLREVEARCPATTIFASNTSTIPIARIAEASRRPQNVVGMHYFSPVEKMPLLEVIRHRGSSDETVATAVSLGKRQGKTVIVVNDGVGFYTSRVLGPYMNEASQLLAEGVPIDVIDRALVDWGWPVGPMTLLDEVGIDIAAHAGRIVHEAFGDRMTPPKMMDRLIADDRKGRKNRRGMYRYDDKGNKIRDEKTHGVDTSVYETLRVTPSAKVPPEEIQMRCVLAFVNEALRCLGEGILRSPRDGDVGAIFGLGFPPFRGGPFRYVDSVGAAEVLRRTEAFRGRFGARFEPAPTLVNLARVNGRFYKD